MFSDPADAAYPDIGWARAFERAQMARWVAEHRFRREAGGAPPLEMRAAAATS